MSKKVSTALSVVLIVLVAMGSVFYFKYASIQFGEVTLAGYVLDTTLEAVSGTDIAVKHEGESEYQKISGSTVLKQGDFVKVGVDSEATILWSDESVTRLASGTEIHITKLTIDAQDPSNTGVSFDIFQGDVWVKAMNIVNDKSRFTIGSGNVVAGLRGTTLNFSVNGKEKKVRAIKHAIYLIGFDLNLSAGEEAKISDAPGNSNGSPSNINLNGMIQGNLLVQVDKISPDIYKSKWFVQNFEQDEQHDQAVKKRLQEKLEFQLQGLDDPLRNFKLNQAIDNAPDDRTKAELLLQLTTQKMQLSILALSKREVERGKALWQQYQELLSRLKEVLTGISDETFVLKIQQTLVANINLWVKYSFLLLPENMDITDAMEETILELTNDLERKRKLRELFDAREFFQMSDRLEDGTKTGATQEQIKTMLEQYKVLLERLQAGGLRDYECKILLSLRDKLKLYVLDLPPVFECVGRSGPSSNQNRNGTPTNGNVNAPINENKNVNANRNLNVNSRVKPVCGNGTCEKNLGETTTSCLKDCPALKAVCGNKTCEKALGETTTTCAQDCPVPKAVCGNNICEANLGETSVICLGDCPRPKPVCGNGICEAVLGESGAVCPADCPVISGEVR